jgi:DNA end-binding protein Ku
MSISFGLVTVPIKVTAAARGESIGFNMLSKCCHARVGQKNFCKACGNDVNRADTLKGYEVEKDRYIEVTEAELEQFAPESTKVMEITAAVEASAIDPILFEASYYLEPAGRKGFALLVAALDREKKVAVANVTMHGREQVVIIRTYKGGLMFHTMFHADEVREAPALTTEKLRAEEIKLACQLLNTQESAFDHKQYVDGYRASIEKLIEAKASKKPIPISKGKPKKEVPADDIMAVMAASLKTRKRA